jgi:ankyrin repeat protein
VDGIDLLLALDFDVDAVDGAAALHEAARRGHMALIALLLAHGADPNVRDAMHRSTPAGWAEHFGNVEAQRLLAALERPGEE